MSTKYLVIELRYSAGNLFTIYFCGSMLTFFIFLYNHNVCVLFFCLGSYLIVDVIWLIKCFGKDT